MTSRSAGASHSGAKNDFEIRQWKGEATMLFKNSLMRGDTPVANAGPSSACKLEYRLPGSRSVRVDELHVSVSMLGFLAGRHEKPSRRSHPAASIAITCPVSTPQTFDQAP